MSKCKTCNSIKSRVVLGTDVCKCCYPEPVVSGPEGIVIHVTDARELKYLEGGGVECPYCGHTALSGGYVEVEGGEASQKVSCNECNREWYDVYTLTGIESIGE